jgi:hypothetical protein
MYGGEYRGAGISLVLVVWVARPRFSWGSDLTESVDKIDSNEVVSEKGVIQRTQNMCSANLCQSETNTDTFNTQNKQLQLLDNYLYTPYQIKGFSAS